MSGRSMTGKAFAATLAATCTVLVPLGARAYEDRNYSAGGTIWVSDVRNYRDLTIGDDVGAQGITHLEVEAYDPATTGTGWTYIKARTITINKFGRIDASSAGYRGAIAGGEGYGTGAGGTPDDPSPGAEPPCAPCDPAPGGGGAHVGAGGTGLWVNLAPHAACSPADGAAGGTAYAFDGSTLAQLMATGMGSAGGAGHSGVNPDRSIKGGNGGGVIILEASTIHLRGALWANGENGSTEATHIGVLGSPAGGGAGGTIIIRANNFDFDSSFLDPETSQAILVSAVGGFGARDRATATVVAGSGSGGLVRLEIGTSFQTELGPLVAVDSGGNGSTCPDPGAAGGLGQVDFLAAPPCVDADGDSYSAIECEGGTDCDDGNTEMNPDAGEACNSVDDNCNGVTDEEPDGGIDAGDPRCGTGSGNICTDAGCVPKDGGDQDAGGPAPPEVRLGGGLCSSSAGMAAGGALGAALVGVLGAAGLARRGRRRGSGSGRTGE